MERSFWGDASVTCVTGAHVYRLIKRPDLGPTHLTVHKSYPSTSNGNALSSSPTRPDLGLQVGLQTQQTPGLGALGVDDAGAHEIRRVRVDFLKERSTKSNDLCERNGGVGTLVAAEGEKAVGSLKSTAVPRPGDAGDKAVTLALVISVSIGCFALKMFWTSCWGLRGTKTSVPSAESQTKAPPEPPQDGGLTCSAASNAGRNPEKPSRWAGKTC